MVGITTDEVVIIEEEDGRKYRVNERTTTFDDPPDKDGKAKETIIVELSREQIFNDKERITLLEAKIKVLEMKYGIN